MPRNDPVLSNLLRTVVGTSCGRTITVAMHVVEYHRCDTVLRRVRRDMKQGLLYVNCPALRAQHANVELVL